MSQRSRKKGRRKRPPQRPAATTAAPGRSARRDEAVRATLRPYAPGERPWAIRISALVALLIGGVQLVLYIAGVKLKVSGTHARAGSTIVFGGLMFACAAGVWMMRYWAVLGFMALMAIFSLYFALALIKASSITGLLIGLAGLAICGSLFYKMVRVLSRIQMPRYPGHEDSTR